MSSIRCVDLLRHAQENSYAVGYFEAWNLESLLAVVRAAEIARSPVMVGFCGEYLANPQRKFKEDINLYGAFARQVAQGASVPVATLLNESIDMNVTYQGVKADFDMVMFVDEGMPIDQLTVVTRKLVEFAHPCGVAVEGEVGSLGMADQASRDNRMRAIRLTRRSRRSLSPRRASTRWPCPSGMCTFLKGAKSSSTLTCWSNFTSESRSR